MRFSIFKLVAFGVASGVTLFPLATFASSSSVQVHSEVHSNTIVKNGETLADTGRTVIDIETTVNGKKHEYHKVWYGELPEDVKKTVVHDSSGTRLRPAVNAQAQTNGGMKNSTTTEKLAKEGGKEGTATNLNVFALPAISEILGTDTRMLHNVQTMDTATATGERTRTDQNIIHFIQTIFTYVSSFFS